MKCSILKYLVLFLSLLQIATGYTQSTSLEKKEDPNISFYKNIIVGARDANGLGSYGSEDIFSKYYRGLELLEGVEDSLKLRFYDDYSFAMYTLGLHNESIKLAKKGVELAEKVPQYVYIGDFYVDLAFNYTALKKYDSVTWAYKKNIKRNEEENQIYQNISAYNNLGYHYYLNLKKYDSALVFFNKRDENPGRVFDSSLTLNWSINDNIALVYMAQGRHAEAKALFKENYDHYGKSRKGYLWRERWLRAGLQYAEVEIIQGNFAKAKDLLKEIENHINTLPDFQGSTNEYFPSKLLLLKTKQQLARATSNFKQADILGTTYHILKDSLEDSEIKRLSSDFNLMREIGLRNAQNTLQQEQVINEIEKKNLELNLKRRSSRIYGLLIIGILISILISGYIYYRKEKIHAKNKQQLQAEYSQNLIKNQEEERIRVARELHDSVGQKLVLLSKKAAASGDEPAKELAGTTLEELRSISRNLHPPALESLGLTKAIESLINEIDANTSTFFTHEIAPVDHVLPKETTLHIYRIIQETLSNMVKHAEAKVASVTITHKENSVEVSITDNGKGFDLTQQLNKQTSLGMKTLMERAKIIHSKLNISSHPNKGTQIQLSIPIL